nr:DeoR/GlpR family DNA-binding transcription regulator [Sporolactobacillus vineae]
MFQEERLALILSHLKTSRTLSVGEICRLFHVSRDTARRDIVKLVRKGAAARTHGGIALLDLQNAVLGYHQRAYNFSDEKKKIGTCAQQFLIPGQLYFLNASTSISCMAKMIDRKVTVYTHSLDTAEILSQRGGNHVYLLGGLLNEKNRYFYDPESAGKLSEIRFDSAFLGTAAITEDGFYYDNPDDAAINGLAVTRSDRIFVLAEHMKFAKKSYFKGFGWEDVQTIITDQNIPAKFLPVAAVAGTEVILA